MTFTKIVAATFSIKLKRNKLAPTKLDDSQCVLLCNTVYLYLKMTILRPIIL